MTRDDDGVISVGGIRLTDLAEQVGTPAYVIDERRLPQPCPRLARGLRRLDGVLRRQVLPVRDHRPLGGRGGAEPRRVLARRAHRRAARRLRPCADRHARQQQVRGGTAAGPRARRRPHHRRLLRRDHPAGEPLRGTRHHGTGDDPGHHRCRGAHPRVHRHRPRGPEVRLLDRRRPGAGRPVPLPPQPAAAAPRRPLPHRQPDLRHQRLRGGRAAHAQAVLAVQGGHRPRTGRARPRRRLRHRLHQGGHAGHADRAGRVACATSSSTSAAASA